MRHVATRIDCPALLNTDLKGQALDFAGSALHAIEISCEAMWNPFISMILNVFVAFFKLHPDVQVLPVYAERLAIQILWGRMTTI